MPAYKICPVCGASLDPGEKCDCGEELREYLEEADDDG